MENIPLSSTLGRLHEKLAGLGGIWEQEANRVLELLEKGELSLEQALINLRHIEASIATGRLINLKLAEGYDEAIDYDI